MIGRRREKGGCQGWLHGTPVGLGKLWYHWLLRVFFGGKVMNLILWQEETANLDNFLIYTLCCSLSKSVEEKIIQVHLVNQQLYLGNFQVIISSLSFSSTHITSCWPSHYPVSWISNGSCQVSALKKLCFNKANLAPTKRIIILITKPYSIGMHFI